MSGIKYSHYDVIRRNITTEKSTMLVEKDYYVFEVNKAATKRNIKNAVSEIYDVEVLAVRTLRRRNKVKMVGGKSTRANRPTASMNKKSSYKKFAYVKLKQGDSIEFIGSEV